MIHKETYLTPKNETTYLCTEDTGLAAYLLYEKQELAGIQRGEEGELLFLIKITPETETITQDYRIVPDIECFSRFLNDISNISKTDARKQRD